MEGEYKVESLRRRKNADGEVEEFYRHFLVKYRHLQANADYSRMIVLFAREITPYEDLKIEYAQSRTSLIYVQVDNYDEVMQGLSEAEKTALMLSVSEILEEWVANLAGFICRVSSDLFIVVLERRALNLAIEKKFVVLDKVRQLVNKNQLPVTLSMGASAADKPSDEQSIGELGTKAMAGLNLALARGGDQVAVSADELRRSKEIPASKLALCPIRFATIWRPPTKFLSWVTPARIMTLSGRRLASRSWPEL